MYKIITITHDLYSVTSLHSALQNVKWRQYHYKTTQGLLPLGLGAPLSTNKLANLKQTDFHQDRTSFPGDGH